MSPHITLTANHTPILPLPKINFNLLTYSVWLYSVHHIVANMRVIKLTCLSFKCQQERCQSKYITKLFMCKTKVKARGQRIQAAS